MPTPCYTMAFVEVTDPAGYEAYRALVIDSLKPYGGEFLVRGGEMTVLEGKAPGPRAVILKFSSREMALSWYDSPAYVQARAIRQANAISHIVLVDGVPED